jgi:hypothetical protein
MTNIWLSGVWPNAEEPTKMGYPTAIRGTITQDRYAGVMGELGDTPAEAPITAHATDADTGNTADSSVWMSSKLLDDGTLGFAVSSALSSAGYKLYDVLAIPGSASATATVVVSDGTTEYTVVTHNVYDDPGDVVFMSTMDAQWDVISLLSVLGDGIETPHIVSVNLDVTYTAHRDGATIVGVNLPEPLHEGANVARVSLFAYGVLATQTVDVPFTVPEGTPLFGQVVASSAYGSTDSGDDSSEDPSDPGDVSVGPRATIASIVDELRKTVSNDVIKIEFVSSTGDDESDSDLPSDAVEATQSIDATASSPWVVSGAATTQITEIDGVASIATYGGTTWVTGAVLGPVSPVEVRVSYRPLWSPTPIFVTSVMTEDGDGTGFFEVPIDGLPSSCDVIVSVAGGAGYTPAEATIFAPVRAGVRLTVKDATIRHGSWASFSARVLPRANGGSMTFQYWDKNHKKWRKLITKKFAWTPIVFRSLAVGPTGWAHCDWRAPAGTWKVRAVYSGAPSLGLIGGTSRTATIKVR